MAGFKEMFSIPSRMLDSALVTAENSVKSFTSAARSIPAKLRILSAPRKNRNDGDSNFPNGASVSSGSLISEKAFSPVNGDYISYEDAVKKRCEKLERQLDSNYELASNRLSSHKETLNLLSKKPASTKDFEQNKKLLSWAYTNLKNSLNFFEKSLSPLDEKSPPSLEELGKFVKPEDGSRDKLTSYQQKLLNYKEECFKDLEKFSRIYKIDCSDLKRKLNSLKIPGQNHNSYDAVLPSPTDSGYSSETNSGIKTQQKQNRNNSSRSNFFDSEKSSFPPLPDPPAYPPPLPPSLRNFSNQDGSLRSAKEATEELQNMFPSTDKTTNQEPYKALMSELSACYQALFRLNAVKGQDIQEGMETQKNRVYTESFIYPILSQIYDISAENVKPHTSTQEISTLNSRKPNSVSSPQDKVETRYTTSVEVGDTSKGRQIGKKRPPALEFIGTRSISSVGMGGTSKGRR